MYAVMAKPVTTPQVKKDSLPEAWIYRADFLSSKVFHIRFGVLNGNTVELYKGDHMVLENAFPLADAKISSVRAAECDVKPQGVNMLKGYFDGSIESKCLVRHAACPFMTLPSSSQICQTLSDVATVQHILRLRVPRTQSILHNKLILGFDTQENALFWHGKLSTAILTGVSASHQRSTSGDRSSVEQVRTLALLFHDICLSLLEICDAQESQAEQTLHNCTIMAYIRCIWCAQCILSSAFTKSARDQSSPEGVCDCVWLLQCLASCSKDQVSSGNAIA